MDDITVSCGATKGNWKEKRGERRRKGEIGQKGGRERKEKKEGKGGEGGKVWGGEEKTKSYIMPWETLPQNPCF